MIIFLYGEDEFRSQRKLAEIKNKFLEKSKEGANLSLFDYLEKSYDLDEIILKASSEGLFSPKQLIIIKNLLISKKDISDEKLLDFLKRKGEGEFQNVVLVFWEGADFDKKYPLAKFLLKAGKCQEFELLEGAKLKSWMISEIGKVGKGKVSISPEAVEKLSVYVGNDLKLLSKEIEKLVSYKDSGEIKDEDVEKLVKSKIDTDIFKTIDALARGDKKTAVKLLHEHIESGDHPLYMLDRYFYQFRNLLKVKSLVEKNMPQPEIASKLKLHPYVVKKSVEQSGRFTFEELKGLYKKLCDIDAEAKTGKVDIELALDKFVAEV